MSLPVPASPAVIDATGPCWANNMTDLSPCLFVSPTLTDWGYQWQTTPVDVLGKGYRKISTQMLAPAATMTYPPFPATAYGDFAIWPACNYDRNWECTYFAAKLPPWPGNGTGASGYNYDRTRWYPLVLGGTGAINEEYQFGYTENGNVTDFFCTNYNDICTSKVPTSTSDPFGFVATDSFSTSSCPCTINAIPGRVLYFRYHNISSNKYGPTQVMAIP
jgi:hypothetical protein